MVIAHSISIRKERPGVFDYLQNFRNRTDFINYMDEVRLVSEKATGLGVQYAEVATILGKKFETVYEVTGFETNRFIEVRSIDAVFPILSRIKLDLLEEGTRLSLEIQVKLPFVMKLGEPLIKGFIDKEALRILETIKSKVEAKKNA